MSARKPTQRERHRAVLSRRAEARLARILTEPRPQLFVPDIGDSDAFHAELHALLAEAILRAGAAERVYAVHFTHDLEEFCAVVGEPLGSGFSNRPGPGHLLGRSLSDLDRRSKPRGGR